jgi:hypothetical protein
MAEGQHLGVEPKFGLAASEECVEEEADEGVEEGAEHGGGAWQRRVRGCLTSVMPVLGFTRLLRWMAWQSD